MSVGGLVAVLTPETDGTDDTAEEGEDSAQADLDSDARALMTGSPGASSDATGPKGSLLDRV